MFYLVGLSDGHYGLSKKGMIHYKTIILMDEYRYDYFQKKTWLYMS